ncbi:MAG TPA: hypothetical protein VFE85_03265 [Woeseiaceae bacterium]|nr:hypothetical protein [Woeseiaceae bacterium]
MTEHDHRQNAPCDADVSRAYRELANERTPPELDRRVLRQAAASASGRFRDTPWLRPFAFAATLLLGVALLFDMQSLTVPVPDTIPETSPPPAAPGEPGGAAAEDPARAAHEPRQERHNATTPGEQPADGVSPLPAAAAAGQAKTGPGAGAADVAREAPSAAAAETASVPPPGAVKFRAAEPRNAAALERRSDEDVETPPCEDEQTRDPAAWWQCIQALRDAGDDAAAAAELERLQQRFPDFRPRESAP